MRNDRIDGALAIAEDSGLVHIEPEPVEGELSEEVGDTCLPDGLGLFLEVVEEDGVGGPDLGSQGTLELVFVLHGLDQGLVCLRQFVVLVL